MGCCFRGVAGLEPAWTPGLTTISASGGRQWGAHQDSSSRAALCHRGGEGREGRRAQKGPRTGTGRSAGSQVRKGSSGGYGLHSARPRVGQDGTEIPGPGQVCARTPVLTVGDTPSSGPTSLLLSPLYNEPLTAGTPPFETLCRRRVRTLTHCGQASGTGAHSPSISRRPLALPVLSHPFPWCPLL